MNSFRTVLAFLLLAASFACSSSPEVAALPESGTGIGLFREPREGLHVTPAMPLRALLESYSQALGWTLLVPEAAREDLEKCRCDVTTAVEVPREQVHGFVEGLVRANGLLLRFAHVSAPVVLELVDPADKQTGDIPANRVLVPLAELPRWEAHPAHMISTQVELPDGDADLLVSSLRAIFGESARGLVMRAGESKALLLSGTGAEVARLVRVIGEAARGAGAALELPAAPGANTRGSELLRVPPHGLQLEHPGAKGIPVLALLEQYTQLMGWNLLADDDARNQAQTLPFEFRAPIEVPAQRVHAFVGGVLRANDFALELVHAGAPVLVRLSIERGRENARLRSSAIEVAASELPRWADYPEFQVRTLFRVPGMDSKVLSNSLRGSFEDSSTQRLFPLGADGLLAVGHPDELGDLAQVLRALVDSAAGSGSSTPAAPVSGAELALLVPPSKGLHLERPPYGDLKIGSLIEQYAQLMGWRVLAGPEVKNQLRVLECRLALPLDIPAENVHAFVEGVARSNDLVFRFAHAHDPVLLEVLSTNVAGQGSPRVGATVVPSSELPRWAGHPAFLVTTAVDLPSLDARTLSNSLRQLFSDQQTQQILPLGNSNSLLVTGFAPAVASLMGLFHALNDSAAGGHPSLPVAVNAPPVLDLFAAPSKPLHLEENSPGAYRLSDLVGAYAELMGWRILVGPDTRNQLLTLRTGIACPVDVAPENVHAFVEGVLKANDFVMGIAHAQDPVLLRISSTNVAGMGNPRADALVVPAAEIPRWAAHPDVLVTTCIELPGIDVRTLSNSLRQMFSDQQTQQIIPVGNTDGLILTGFGSDVAGIVKMFRGLADAAGGAHVPLPEIPSPRSYLDLLVAPAQGLHLVGDAKGRMKLAELLDLYTKQMGWRLVADSDTRNELRTLDCGFELPLDVAAADVHAFVESVARDLGFVLSFAHTQEPVLLRVETRNVSGRNNPRSDSFLVPPGDLPRWAGHPDFLVTTCLDMPGIDVRTLSNSLRQTFSDQQTQQIVPMGNTDGLVVTGFASDVSGMVRVFHSLVAAAAGTHVPIPAIPDGKSGIELFTTPAQGLHLEANAKGVLPIGDLLDAYAARMGWRVISNPGTRNQLRMTACDFALPLDVAPEELHGFVESVARAHQFVLGFAHVQAPVLLRVQSLSIAGKGSPRKDAAPVPPGELPRWAAHSGFLITTCIDLPGLDVPTLANSLRSMFSDQQTQQIVPLGSTDGLIVTGFASDVVSLASSFAELSRAGAAMHVPEALQPPTADRARLFPRGHKPLALEAPAGRAPEASEVLETFAKWSGRPLVMSDAARAALEQGERPFGEPQTIPEAFVYPFVGLLLVRAHCTLSPVPPAAPVNWIVEVAPSAKRAPAFDLPTIPYEQISAWNGYSATPFQVLLQLPETADTKRVQELADLLARAWPECRMQPTGTAAVLLSGTPQDLQAVASALLAACEPVPAGGK